MGKSFKDSLKALEADIQHANILALDHPRGPDGVRLQMRLSFSPAAHLFLFFVRWADCWLAGALGLLRVGIFMINADGKTIISFHERKASIKEFYAVIYPSLRQLQSGIKELVDKNQKETPSLRFSRKDNLAKEKLSLTDKEREEECGICLEVMNKVVLPNCTHTLCLKCYKNWRRRSQSCPFCRDNLRRVNSDDLWIYIDENEIVDLPLILKENLQRLFIYVEKLPLIDPDNVSIHYDCCGQRRVSCQGGGRWSAY